MTNYVTQSEFAKIVGISGRRVGQLKAEGVLPASLFNSDSKIDQTEGLLVYCEHLREIAAGRQVIDENGEVLDITAESAALKKQQRLNAEQDHRKKQVEADLVEGKVIDRDAVATVASFIISSARNKIVALPTKVSSSIQGLSRDDIAAIDEIANTILDELHTDLPDAIAGAMYTK